MLDAKLLAASLKPAAVPTALILALQAYAIRIGDAYLKSTCWTALGYSQRYSFTPVTVDERDRALAVVAGQIEMLRCMSVKLPSVEV